MRERERERGDTFKSTKEIDIMLQHKSRIKMFCPLTGLTPLAVKSIERARVGQM